MPEILEVLTDLSAVIFNLLIYFRLTVFKKKFPAAKTVAMVGCVPIFTAYVICTYMVKIPTSTAAIVCMTLPSLLLFFFLSEYRGARFWLTFSLADCITIIFTFFPKMLGLYVNDFLAFFVLVVLLAAVYVFGRKDFDMYRKSIESSRPEWAPLAISSVLIYFTLLFYASYPKPMMERTEYMLSYGVLCITFVFVHIVIFSSLRKNLVLLDHYQKLEAAQNLHRIAYTDALTGLQNRMAYTERFEALKGMLTISEKIAFVVFDIDNFKHINDTFGHSVGDKVLIAAADLLREYFGGSGSEIYRIGGDEFVVIAEDISIAALADKLSALREYEAAHTVFCFSKGFAFVDPNETDCIDKAFGRADNMLYSDKRMKKTN